MLRQDSPSAISKAALSGDDDKASEAVDMFLSIIGAEAGHMGLRLLAKGGVYICGGITPKVRRLQPERAMLARAVGHYALLPYMHATPTAHDSNW